MKHYARIKELLNNGMHSRCIFHFVAENKKDVGLVCVVKNNIVNSTKKGEQICLIGSPDDPVFRSSICLADFYSLMLGEITMPIKLKLKEIITG